MATLYLEYNGDFVVSPQRGLLMAEGWPEVRQRIVRRILTTPRQQQPDGTFSAPDYVFDGEYGIGLRQKIGQNLTAQNQADIEQAVTAGVTIDQSTNPSVAPQISIRQGQGHSFFVLILVRLLSGDPGKIALQVE